MIRIIKLHKVYLYNFKGIKEKSIIQFDDHNTMLIGPNGYGKTTVFDAVELCLTGNIYRNERNKNVTKHYKQYKKPFFQNTEEKPVVIKLWIQNDSDEDFIIVKYLDPVTQNRNYKGKKNKPDDFTFLETYYEEKEEFGKDIFNPNTSEEIDQEDINQFMGTNKNKIENIYNLFNYIQQDEVSYFIKKSENDRKSMLSDLFNTKQDEEVLEQQRFVKTKLNNLAKYIKSRMKERHNADVKYNDAYYKLLFKNKKLELDSENVFEDIDLDLAEIKHRQYLNEIDQLINFISKFSPRDYQHKKEHIKLSSLIKNNNFLLHLIVEPLIVSGDLKKIKKINDIVNNNNILKSIILQEYLTDYRKINETYQKYKEYTKIAKIVNKEHLAYEDLSNLSRYLPEDSRAQYQNTLITYKQLQNDQQNYDQTYHTILNLRTKLDHEWIQVEDRGVDREFCPFCGFNWGEHELLKKSYNDQTQFLKGQLNETTEKISDLYQMMVKDYIDPLRIENETNLNNNLFDDDNIKVYDEIEKLKHRTDDYTNIFKLDDILSEFIWDELKSVQDLKNYHKELKEVLIKKYSLDNIYVEKIINMTGIDFKKETEFIKPYLIEEKQKEYTVESIEGLSRIEVKFEYLKEKINIQRNAIKYSDMKSKDNNQLYLKYFDENPENFHSYNINDFVNKKMYLQMKYDTLVANNNSVFSKKLTMIYEKIKKIESNNELLSQTIEDYKREMVDSLKIPFYIYNSRILQNYQQGMGIFISNNDRKDGIRFITDSSSDHDAIHHLSAGQLAVVSLAFNLALNKVYNSSNNNKFIIIDDPIQDMDSLNTYSFVELLKNDFIHEYQLILSTHRDFDALFTKYKFMQKESDTLLINVQKELNS